jgi:hypothetical protein
MDLTRGERRRRKERERKKKGDEPLKIHSYVCPCNQIMIIIPSLHFFV